MLRPDVVSDSNEAPLGVPPGLGMIAIHALSPENEMRVAERLALSIERLWPGVKASAADKIDILVGARTPTDVDILVLVNLANPRPIPPQRRRRAVPSLPASVETALIVIEVKQLDTDSFARIGNQLYPIYNGVQKTRSVAKQASDAAYAVNAVARGSGANPFVHAVAWLTEYDDEGLLDIETCVLGSKASWGAILDAALQQRRFAETDDDLAVAKRAIEGVRGTFLNNRKTTKRDRAKVESLSRELVHRAAVDTLVARAGTAQIRLIGRGGSGKTTSLALLAVALAETGRRVLFLTFHLTLRSDIAHLIDGLAQRTGIPTDRIAVRTTASFLLSTLDDLGVAMPRKADGSADYNALDRVLDETRAMLVGGPDDADSDIARLRAKNPEVFDWDHIFVDESQDCTDAERDFLRALYGHRRLVLADGVDQLVRRQVACDWQVGMPRDEIVTHRLEKSLRMLRNIATFVNCFARALDLPTWRIEPQEDLPGGRVIIAVGRAVSEDLLRAIVTAAKDQHADAADCLICVPPKIAGDDGVRNALLAAGEGAGIALWDGTDPKQRASATAGPDALRLVRYESCRGLEGWVTVALDIDVFVKNRREHPNLNPNDAPVAADVVANRAMLIPLTRAVQTLVITIDDPESDVASRLRTAIVDPAMPRGVVEWVDANALASAIAGPVAAR